MELLCNDAFALDSDRLNVALNGTMDHGLTTLNNIWPCSVPVARADLSCEICTHRGVQRFSIMIECNAATVLFSLYFSRCFFFFVRNCRPSYQIEHPGVIGTDYFWSCLHYKEAMERLFEKLVTAFFEGEGHTTRECHAFLAVTMYIGYSTSGGLFDDCSDTRSEEINLKFEVDDDTGNN
jgi:hypothetical protein